MTFVTFRLASAMAPASFINGRAMPANAMAAEIDFPDNA